MSYIYRLLSERYILLPQQNVSVSNGLQTILLFSQMHESFGTDNVKNVLNSLLEEYESISIIYYDPDINIKCISISDLKALSYHRME